MSSYLLVYGSIQTKKGSFLSQIFIFLFFFFVCVCAFFVSLFLCVFFWSE